jgi:hypothetical protein
MRKNPWKYNYSVGGGEEVVVPHPYHVLAIERREEDEGIFENLCDEMKML